MAADKVAAEQREKEQAAAEEAKRQDAERAKAAAEEAAAGAAAAEAAAAAAAAAQEAEKAAAEQAAAAAAQQAEKEAADKAAAAAAAEKQKAAEEQKAAEAKAANEQRPPQPPHHSSDHDHGGEESPRDANSVRLTTVASHLRRSGLGSVNDIPRAMSEWHGTGDQPSSHPSSRASTPHDASLSRKASSVLGLSFSGYTPMTVALHPFSPDDNIVSTWQQRLKAVLERFYPDKLSMMNALLEKYKGKEDKLFDDLKKKVKGKDRDDFILAYRAPSQNDAVQQVIIDTHNHLRGKHGAGSLRFDAKKAARAMAHATQLMRSERCVNGSQENESGVKEGQNVWSGRINDGETEQDLLHRAVDDWYSANAKRDHGTAAFERFVQVVWKGVQDIGGYVMVDKTGDAYVVVNYGPQVPIFDLSSAAFERNVELPVDQEAAAAEAAAADQRQRQAAAEAAAAAAAAEEERRKQAAAEAAAAAVLERQREAELQEEAARRIREQTSKKMDDLATIVEEIDDADDGAATEPRRNSAVENTSLELMQLESTQPAASDTAAFGADVRRRRDPVMPSLSLEPATPLSVQPRASRKPSADRLGNKLASPKHPPRAHHVAAVQKAAEKQESGVPAGRVVDDVTYTDGDGDLVRFGLHTDGLVSLKIGAKLHRRAVNSVRVSKLGAKEYLLAISTLKLAVPATKAVLRRLLVLFTRAANLQHNLQDLCQEPASPASPLARFDEAPAGGTRPYPPPVFWNDGDDAVSVHRDNQDERVFLTIKNRVGDDSADEVSPITCVKLLASPHPTHRNAFFHSLYFPELKKAIDVPSPLELERLYDLIEAHNHTNYERVGGGALLSAPPRTRVKHDIPPCPRRHACQAAFAAVGVVLLAASHSWAEQKRRDICEIMRITGSPERRARLYLGKYNSDIDTAVAAMFASGLAPTGVFDPASSNPRRRAEEDAAVREVADAAGSSDDAARVFLAQYAQNPRDALRAMRAAGVATTPAPEDGDDDAGAPGAGSSAGSEDPVDQVLRRTRYAVPEGVVRVYLQQYGGRVEDTVEALRSDGAAPPAAQGDDSAAGAVGDPFAVPSRQTQPGGGKRSRSIGGGPSGAGAAGRRMFPKGWHGQFYRGDLELRGVGYIAEVHRKLEREVAARFNVTALGITLLGGSHRAVAALFPMEASPGVSPASSQHLIAHDEAVQLSLCQKARRNFLLSYALALKGLGLEVLDVKSGAVTRPGQKRADAGWSRPAECDRFRVLNTKDGAGLRKLVTRMVHALQVFGYAHMAFPLVRFLARAVVDSPHHLSRCRDACVQWIAALRDYTQREELMGVLSGAHTAPWRGTKAQSPIPAAYESPSCHPASSATRARRTWGSGDGARTPPSTSHPASTRYSAPGSAAAAPSRRFDGSAVSRQLQLHADERDDDTHTVGGHRTPDGAFDAMPSTMRGISPARTVGSSASGPPGSAHQSAAFSPTQQQPPPHPQHHHPRAHAHLPPALLTEDEREQKRRREHGLLQYLASVSRACYPSAAAFGGDRPGPGLPKVRLEEDAREYRIIVQAPAQSVRVALMANEISIIQVGDANPNAAAADARGRKVHTDELSTMDPESDTPRLVLSAYKRSILLPRRLVPSLCRKDPYASGYTVCVLPKEVDSPVEAGCSSGADDYEEAEAAQGALSPRRPTPSIILEETQDCYRLVLKGSVDGMVVRPEVSSVSVLQRAVLVPAFTSPSAVVLFDELTVPFSQAHARHLDESALPALRELQDQSESTGVQIRVFPPSTRLLPLAKPILPSDMSVVPYGLSHVLVTLPVLSAVSSDFDV